MKPIAIFYHALFELGAPPKVLPQAVDIVREQMTTLTESGLLSEASKFVVGINGGIESHEISNLLIPSKSEIVLHGLESRAENLTIIEIEKFCSSHPDWYVLYFHTKGATHDPNSDYGKFAGRWRRCMMKRCVVEWRQAVAELDDGFEAVGCHWLTGMGSDKSQHFFAGTFWWATSNFLATVPSMYLRDRIKQSGISNVESRYEAEVWIGNGKLPKVKDLEIGHGLGQCP